jgi:hypothetical protein
MDYLWHNCGETAESLKMQAEMADFIRIKDEELKAISEHFENLNKMELEKADVEEGKSKGQSGKKSPLLGGSGGEAGKTGKQEPSKGKK